jgi:superfamily II DNA/RNA helicase
VNFDSFSFDERIRSGIRACGYVSPTPIQGRAIPDVLAGHDVLGLAQTGTGKTAAFVLPILQRLLNADAPKQGPVRVLVLAPTRELALQIHESFVALGKQTGIRSSAVFGGVGAVPQIKALSRSSVCVACPGRLLDLINRGDADLSQVETLVIDEADRMFDMGFLPDLRRILARLPRDRQNLLFSATMPREIRSLADGVLRNPVTVQVDNNAPAKTVSHALYPVSSHLKPNLLEALLRKTEHECVLVFTRTKHRAKSLARKLENRGWAATSLQGNLSQNRRQEALEGFRRGSYRIMVATDIAARGIDCEKISHVINFDLPDTAETYTHRIGRTGRAERSGEALTLVTGEDELQVRAIERILGSSIERRKLDGFDYSAAGQRPDPRDEARGPARNAGRNNGRDNGRNASRGGGRGAGRNGAQPRAAREASGQERGTEGRAARSVSDDRIARDNPYARTLPPLEQPQRAGAARSGTARSRDGEEDQGAGRSRRGRRGGRGKSRNAAQGAPQRRNA